MYACVWTGRKRVNIYGEKNTQETEEKVSVNYEGKDSELENYLKKKKKKKSNRKKRRNEDEE